MDTLFVCPKCGNTKEFNIFTSNVRDVRPSSDLGMRADESVLPSGLRQGDTHIECKRCLEKIEYKNSATEEKKYIKANLKLYKITRSNMEIYNDD